MQRITKVELQRLTFHPIALSIRRTKRDGYAKFPNQADDSRALVIFNGQLLGDWWLYRFSLDRGFGFIESFDPGKHGGDPVTIKLYGDLGRRFGKLYRLDVATPAEAVHALCSQLRGLRQYFLGNATQKFLVRGYQDYDETDLHYPQSTGTLKIVPLVQGTGAWGIIIAGAALAVVGFFVPVVGPAMMSMGIALALGCVSQLLAPRQESKGATPEKAENQPSLAFDGAVNTVGQGGPVPLGYGRLLVGSQVISVGFSTNNEILV